MSPRGAILLVVTLQLALCAGLYLTHRGALVDDAYISFRYAARWAQGYGLTWNDGLRVEGFSNPLWTLGLGALAKVGIPPHQGALPLGVLAALAATGVVYQAARRRGAWPAVALLVSLGFALDLGLAHWAGSGLETSVAALLVASFLAVSTRDLRGAGGGALLGLLGSGLALVRPEGALWVAWAAAWLIWVAWVPGRVLGGFVAGLAPAAAYLVFRVDYFGRLLPNTFFAKLEPSGLGLTSGLADLRDWLLAHAVWGLLGLAAVLRARQRAPAGDRLGLPRGWVWLPAGLLGIEALFVVAVGGDWMGRMRYLAPMTPAFYLMLAEVPAAGLSFAGLRWRVAIGLLLAAHVALGWGFRDTIPTYTREGRALGSWLKASADTGDVVAVTAAGAIPYFSGLTTVDVLGINDPRVRRHPPRHAGPWTPGHHRYDLEEVLDMNPDWIVWDFGVRLNRHRWRTYAGWSAKERATLDYRRELFAHTEFTRHYEVDTAIPREIQNTYTVFRRKDEAVRKSVREEASPKGD